MLETLFLFIQTIIEFDRGWQLQTRLSGNEIFWFVGSVIMHEKNKKACEWYIRLEKKF